MAAPPFDTHHAVKVFTATGVDEALAEATEWVEDTAKDIRDETR